MRIISSFHDYYDIGMKYGVDNSIVYTRESMQISDEKIIKNVLDKILPFSKFKHTFFTREAPNFECVLFCGKIIPFLFLDFCDNKHTYSYTTIQRNVYSVYDYEEFINNNKYNFCDELKELFYKKTKFISSSFTKNSLTKFYSLADVIPKQNIIDVHLMFNAPIILVQKNGYENSTITLNQSLRDLHFMKMYDPITAFQELQMFLSTFMITEKPITKISDVIRLEKHGFDKKTSFRKGKQ